MRSPTVYNSGHASPRRTSASQLTIDSTPAGAATHKQQSRSVAYSTDKHTPGSPASASPRTPPCSPGLTRPPWDSSPRVSNLPSHRVLVPASHSSSKRSMSASGSAVNGEVEAAAAPAKQQGQQAAPSPSNGTGDSQKRILSSDSPSKRHHVTDSIPGSGQVLGLVKDYIAPNGGEQQEAQQPEHGQQQQQPQEHMQNLKSPLPISNHAADATAAGVAAGAAVKVSPLDSSSLPSVGTSSALSQQQLEVLGAWYSLYCPDKEAQQVAALVKQYDEKANFEDNFVQAYGRDQIGVQFYGMRRCVKGISVALEKVEVLNSTAKSSSGTYQLRIISRISFFLPSLIRGPITSLLLPPAVEAWATDTLTVRESDHVVVHHQQRVHNIPTLPWPLRAYAGFTSSLFMMHVLGW